MLPRNQRLEVVQGIWRRAPSLPLPLRVKNLRRAELLVTLWRAIDQRKAAGNGDESPDLGVRRVADRRDAAEPSEVE
jgi:hypothetical protein